MKCISALSTARNTEAALASLLERAARDMAGEPADLALVFTSEHHAGALDRIAREVRLKGLGRHILGCTGESIVGEDREVEGSAALSLWAIRLPGVELQPRRLTFDGGGFPEWSDAPATGKTASVLLLGDPFTFPADQFLKQVNETSAGLRVVGGMASGGPAPGLNRLVLDGAVFEDGAVAMVVDGPLTLRTIVSQGCRPIGRPMIVTKVDRNIIRELGRRPALEVLREVFEGLPEDEQARVQQGLHVGRVINEYQERFGRGDFLIRNVLGADEAGGIAISDFVRVGQTVQFHVRDAETADEDLHGLLQAERRERPEARLRGALLFSCNGRGSRLFPEPNHDVGLIRQVLGPLPVAGLFAMGEIGPVGGQNFLHGFTASIVLFEEPS
ncbi:MAG TPA: FIST N-terminal domain-containing protein [Isosphaeraceae bacterium]|nr:FIST N-terminal domain-containing protein [Isosphaeraceae bacterium]